MERVGPRPAGLEKHKLKQTKRPVRELLADEDGKLDEIESREFAELREFSEIMGLRRRKLLLTWPQVDFDEATIAIIGKGNKPAGHDLFQDFCESLPAAAVIISPSAMK